MKKTMFNDKFQLTQAVLERIKTMTRRPVSERCLQQAETYRHEYYADTLDALPLEEALLEFSPFKVGEVVAVAQRYCDCGYNPDMLQRTFVKKPTVFPDLDPISPLSGWIDLPLKYHKGWSNKMFVDAGLMPHQIRITSVRLERLQEISDQDCIREGIDYIGGYSESYYFGHGVENTRLGTYIRLGNSYREAFATLIDKVSGKGTFESNPWVYVYKFELVK